MAYCGLDPGGGEESTVSDALVSIKQTESGQSLIVTGNTSLAIAN